jgi:hypothetical protein
MSGFDSAPEKTYNLSMEDTGSVFIVDAPCIQYSEFLNSLVSADREVTDITVPDSVSTEAMPYIIDYLVKYHETADKASLKIPKPINISLKMSVKNWQYEFATNIMSDTGNLWDQLTKAALFLSITPLFELLAAAAADFMISHTPEASREKFGIPNDLTQEEVDEIISKNTWTDSLIDYE